MGVNDWNFRKALQNGACGIGSLAPHVVEPLRKDLLRDDEDGGSGSRQPSSTVAVPGQRHIWPVTLYVAPGAAVTTYVHSHRMPRNFYLMGLSLVSTQSSGNAGTLTINIRVRTTQQDTEDLAAFDGGTALFSVFNREPRFPVDGMVHVGPFFELCFRAGERFIAEFDPDGAGGFGGMCILLVSLVGAHDDDIIALPDQPSQPPGVPEPVVNIGFPPGSNPLELIV